MHLRRALVNALVVGVAATSIAANVTHPKVAATADPLRPDGEILSASFSASGELEVFESGTKLSVSPDTDSSPTMRISTGNLTTGTSIATIAYYEPSWVTDNNIELVESGDLDGDHAWPESSDDAAEDASSSVEYTAEDYDANDLLPVAAEVSSLDEIVILVSDHKLTMDEDRHLDPPIVSRDGVLMGELQDDGTFTDHHPEQGVAHVYSIEIDETSTFSMAATGFAELTSGAASLKNNRIWFNYKTFIPAERASVLSGKVCNIKYPIGRVYFSGDNRGYSSSSNKNRTRALVLADFGTKKMSLSRWVGATKRYADSKSTKVVNSGTASDKGIKLTKSKMNKNSATFQLNHKVGNPLCFSAGAISYQVSGSVWRNGTASFYGSRVRAPHHEAYVVGSSGGSWKTVMRRDLKDFYCLNLGCGRDDWSAYFHKSIN